MISLSLIAQIGQYIYEHHFKNKKKKKKPFSKFERDGNTHLYVILTVLSLIGFTILTYCRLYDGLILRWRYLGIGYGLGALFGVGIILIIKAAIHNHEVSEAFKEQGKLVREAKRKADEQMDRLEELTK